MRPTSMEAAAASKRPRQTANCHNIYAPSPMYGEENLSSFLLLLPPSYN